jgi:hypothetical protein
VLTAFAHLLKAMKSRGAVFGPRSDAILIQTLRIRKLDKETYIIDYKRLGQWWLL